MKSPRVERSFKGADFFDAGFFHHPETRPFFYKFIAELKILSDEATMTYTHGFIKRLHDKGKIARWYTQNIDCLEAKAGLITSSEFADKVKDLIEPSRKAIESRYPKASPLVVTLHGSLHDLVCVLCKTKAVFSRDQIKLFHAGDAPKCEACLARASERMLSGKRLIKVGTLRPNIVLYNELHPEGDYIADCIKEDIRKLPNMLIIIGTSLKVLGLKRMVKDFAKIARTNSKSLILYINKTPSRSKEWESVFDYELIGDCDSWCRILDACFAQCEQKPRDAKQTDIRTFVRATKGSQSQQTKA